MISEYEKYGESALPGHGSALYNSQYEIKKLKRENEALRAELELLKKYQAAFMQDYGRERPKDGLIVHTDQGSQFTSGNFQTLLRTHGALSSVSRKGNPYDNTLMESFYGTIKRELIQDSHA